MEKGNLTPPLPTWEDFLEFDKRITEVAGFKRMNKQENDSDFQRLKLQAPRSLEGRETGYRYTNASGYSVKIWTTVLWDQQRLRDTGTDAGWVIIVKGDKLVYCARYFMRTKGFFLRLARYGWIAKWKIDNVPLCPCEDCKSPMYMYRKKGTRQYMWRCSKPEKHETDTFRSWDYGLGPKAKAFLGVRRAQTEKLKEKNKKLGIEPIPKATTRKHWS